MSNVEYVLYDGVLASPSGTAITYTSNAPDVGMYPLPGDASVFGPIYAPRVYARDLTMLELASSGAICLSLEDREALLFARGATACNSRTTYVQAADSNGVLSIGAGASTMVNLDGQASSVTVDSRDFNVLGDITLSGNIKTASFFSGGGAAKFADRQLLLGSGEATDVFNSTAGIYVAGVPADSNVAGADGSYLPCFEKSITWNAPEGADLRALGTAAGAAAEPTWRVCGGALELKLDRVVNGAVRPVSFKFRINERDELELVRNSFAGGTERLAKFGAALRNGLAPSFTSTFDIPAGLPFFVLSGVGPELAAIEVGGAVAVWGGTPQLAAAAGVEPSLEVESSGMPYVRFAGDERALAVSGLALPAPLATGGGCTVMALVRASPAGAAAGLLELAAAQGGGRLALELRADGLRAEFPGGAANALPLGVALAEATWLSIAVRYTNVGGTDGGALAEVFVGDMAAPVMSAQGGLPALTDAEVASARAGGPAAGAGPGEPRATLDVAHMAVWPRALASGELTTRFSGVRRNLGYPDEQTPCWLTPALPSHVSVDKLRLTATNVVHVSDTAVRILPSA